MNNIYYYCSRTTSAPQGLDWKNSEECTQEGFGGVLEARGGQGTVVAEEQSRRHRTLGSSLCVGASLGAGSESPEAPRAKTSGSSKVRAHSQATSPDSHWEGGVLE